MASLFDPASITPGVVRETLRHDGLEELSRLPLEKAGHGTDNVMMRLGAEFVVRLPQHSDAAAAIDKEARWLPRIAGQVTQPVPTLVHQGGPTPTFARPWAIYRWIDGHEPTSVTVTDWAAFGDDLAGFVRSLHAVDVSSVSPDSGMRWYRGQPLADFTLEAHEVIDEIAELAKAENIDIDIARLRAVWDRLVATPQRVTAPVLLHGDLRAANLLVADGGLAAVIDFGTLSIGQPAAEHAPVWSFPQAARDAYRAALDLDDDAWVLSLGWALLPSLTGLPFYWTTWPEFALGCLDRIRLVMTEVGEWI